MRYTICLALLAAALAGCAPSYTLSDEGLKYRSYLSDDDAYRRVRMNIIDNGRQAGLCAAHTSIRFAQAEQALIDPPYLVFSSFVRDDADTTPNAARKTTMQINLKDVDAIWVEGEPSTAGCGDAAGRSPRGSLVTVVPHKAADAGKDGPHAVMINVSEDNLDLLLAALSYLSPKAKLLRGAGR